jgi:hypothetical protein
MAFDNNRNTPGDYHMFVKSNEDTVENALYPHSAWGNPTQILLPGNGLLSGPMHADVLCKNYADIESSLRGIRANDLVNGPFVVVAELEKPRTLDIYNKPAPIMPKPLVVSRDNRPMYLS